MKYKDYLKPTYSLRGFTLVETLIVLAMFVVIITVLTEGIVSFYRLNGYTIAQSYQVDHARRGIDRMITDIREMAYADNGAYPLVKMNTREIGFFSDTEGSDSVEYIEYKLSSTTLYRKVFYATGTPLRYSTTTPNATSTVSEYVQNGLQSLPIFVYYDTEGNPATGTTTVTDIRYIETNLIINIDPIRDPGQYMLQSSAAPRNLKN